jgi:hypothetical protein
MNTTNGSQIAPLSYTILGKHGYFHRHFVLCGQINGTQQDAYEQVEEEYQSLAKELRLEKKIMFGSYESFRNGKSTFYADLNNR